MRRFTTDLRHAWRALLQRKAYYVTCAATLTLVLGANAAIFAVVSATMLRPMPFATAGEVLSLYSQPPGTTTVAQRNPLQQMELPWLRERARTVTRVEGFYATERVMTRGGEPVVARTAAVTPGFLVMLGAPLAQGRPFTQEEGQPGHFVAVVTDRYWQELGGGPALGSSIVLDGQPHTVVGVLAPSFAVPFLDVQILVPLVASPEPAPRSPTRTVVGFAELAPGATLAQARDEMTALSTGLAQAFPRTHNGWRLGAETAREWQYGAMRTPLLMLLAAAAVVLLIACVNLANLAAAQAVARSGELALRLALGASRADVFRGYVAEMLIVAASGLVPGLLVARAAVPALLASDPTIARTLGDVAIDWRVQAFSAVVALLVALLAALVPALRAMRRQAAPEIAAGTQRSTGAPAATRLGRAMVSVEVALCLALVMAGAVVVRGLFELAHRSPGFVAAGVLTAQVRLPDADYKTPAGRAAVIDRMLDAVRALPGVSSAAITQNAFVPGFSYQTLLTLRDRPTPDGQPHTVQFRRVSPDYFRVMQMRIVAGRAFAESDVLDAPPVAIVSRGFADALFDRADPVGQVLLRGTPTATALTVVGVADDAFDVSLTQAPEPTVYVPWAQNNNSSVPVAFVIRTAVAPAALLPAVRGAIRRVDSSLPLRRPQPLEAFLEESTAPERFRTLLLGLLAALGLGLAAVGIAGVTYRGVVVRTREFAVRLALGAAPGGIVGLVMRESLRDLAAGSAAGLTIGAALCALLAHVLADVGAVDAVTAGLSAAIMTAVGVGAALVPALRALRVQPAEALRS